MGELGVVSSGPAVSLQVPDRLEREGEREEGGQLISILLLDACPQRFTTALRSTRQKRKTIGRPSHTAASGWGAHIRYYGTPNIKGF